MNIKKAILSIRYVTPLSLYVWRDLPQWYSFPVFAMSSVTHYEATGAFRSPFANLLHRSPPHWKPPVSVCAEGRMLSLARASLQITHWGVPNSVKTFALVVQSLHLPLNFVTLISKVPTALPACRQEISPFSLG